MAVCRAFRALRVLGDLGPSGPQGRLDEPPGGEGALQLPVQLHLLLWQQEVHLEGDTCQGPLPPGQVSGVRWQGSGGRGQGPQVR